MTEAILGDDRVRKLSFTGSTEVGRGLLAQAAERVVNVSMELGGNAPFLVFADADLDAAVEGAMVAKLRHNGETCTAANRFYVEAPVAAAFAERLAERFEALRVGPGIDPDTELGPLVDEAGREKVERLVQAAVDGGAKVTTGGRRPADRDRGFFYAPTVLEGVAPDSPITAEEVFGPVAPIVSFDDEAEAIAAANDTIFGLVSYVFTGDLERGSAGRRGARDGHGRGQRGSRLRPGRPLRRREAVGSRARGQRRGRARLLRAEVRPRQLVTAAPAERAGGGDLRRVLVRVLGVDREPALDGVRLVVLGVPGRLGPVGVGRATPSVVRL